MGRLTIDKVSTLGTGVDGWARRIDRVYEIRGMVEKITTYSDTSASTAVNEVLREYNDLGMLDKEYQEHEGTKDGNTLYVQHNYDNTTSSGDGDKLGHPRVCQKNLPHTSSWAASSWRSDAVGLD